MSLSMFGFKNFEPCCKIKTIASVVVQMFPVFPCYLQRDGGNTILISYANHQIESLKSQTCNKTSKSKT